MLRYNVAQLLLAPTGTTRALEIEEKEFWADDVQVQNLHGRILLTRLRDEILAQGELEGTVVLECSRCLEPFQAPLHLEVEIEFRPSVPIPATGKAISLPDDDQIYTLDSHHTLSLVEAVRESVILNLPMRPICRPDCAGLCPVCGANLNENPCGGHEESVDERLAVLASLLRPKKPAE